MSLAPNTIENTKKVTERKSVNQKIYDSLTKRLGPFIEKLSLEDQTEIDGIISIFSDDVARAVRTVTFFELR